MTRFAHSDSQRRLVWACAGFGAALAFVAAAGCGTNHIDGLGPGPGGGDVGIGGRIGSGDGGIIIVDPGSCDPGANGGASGGALPPGTLGPVGMRSPAAPALDGIMRAVEPPPPISGGTLITLRDGATAVAGDPDRDRIYVVDVGAGSSLALRWSIPLAAGAQPGRLVEDGAGRVQVVLRGAGKVVTVDPVAGAVVLERAACATPRGIAYDPASDRLHLACADGNLLTFAPAGTTPERTVTLPMDLRDVVVDGPRLMVTRFRTADVLVLDASGTMTEVIHATPFANTLVHGGTRFSPAVAWRAVGMPDGGAVMVHQRGFDGAIVPRAGGYGGLSPCDGIVHTAVTRVKSGQRPAAGPAMAGFVLPVDVAVSSDGKRLAMVAAGNGHAAPGAARRLFITNTDDATAEWRDDAGGSCGSDDHHGPTPTPQCDRVPGTGIPPKADGTCPTGNFPCGLVCIAEGLTCDLASPARPTIMGMGGAGGSGPGTYAVHCGAELATVGNAVAEPVAVAFVDQQRVLVQTREPAQVQIVSDHDGAFGVLTLSQESRVDTGHAIFHSNSGGGLACASCHPEGHEDGRVWNFQCGETRRTQDISGGLKGTEPFHWTGDMMDFPTLVDNVFVGRMSGPQLSRDQTSATLDWINSIPKKPALRLATDAQVMRGKALFERADVGCFSCHAGSALTNNQTVNVGTSAAFQVPSLRGVAWRAPFLHDGCASTLGDRFTDTSCSGGDSHGHTSQLSSSDVGDLVAFLQSL